MAEEKGCFLLTMIDYGGIIYCKKGSKFLQAR